MKQLNLHSYCRYGLLMFLFFAIGSCDQADQNASGTNTDSTLPAQPASTQWLVSLYSKAIDTTIFNTENLHVTYFRQLNDSATYCLFQISDELCAYTFLATQVNRKNKEIRQIEENCDGDFSQPEYTYSDYRFDSSSNTFTTTEYKETAKPEFLIEENGNKRFKEGYNMENAKTTTDSMVVVRRVRADGKISEAAK